MTTTYSQSIHLPYLLLGVSIFTIENNLCKSISVQFLIDLCCPTSSPLSVSHLKKGKINVTSKRTQQVINVLCYKHRHSFLQCIIHPDIQGLSKAVENKNKKTMVCEMKPKCTWLITINQSINQHALYSKLHICAKQRD